MLFFALCLGAAAALAPAAVAADAADASGALPARAFSLDRADVGSLHLAKLATSSWGGRVTASNGETVDIQISELYPEDRVLLRSWADELVSLAHGSEIARVHVFLGTLDEVQSICGWEALACYSPVEQTIFTPAEDVPRHPSARAVLAHEYGHHLAANRNNEPWRAVDWGTKRWATVMGVCARARDDTFFPGAEQQDYELNPGEGFAEAYRVFNERRLGRPESAWEIVSHALYPHDRALAALEQDIRQPWTGPAVRAMGGVFARGAVPTRSVTVRTPLDGTAVATLRAPRGTRFTVELVSPAGRVLRRATSTGAPASVRTTVCGARSLDVRVRRDRGFGRYSLTLSTP